MWNKVIYVIVFVAILYIFKNYIIKAVKFLSYQYKFWLFFLWTSFLNTITLPLFALRPKDVRNAIFIANGMAQVTKIIGIKWNLRNGDILAEDRGAVIVANHQSAIDILADSAEGIFKLQIGLTLPERIIIMILITFLIVGATIFLGMSCIWHVIAKCAIVSKKEMMYMFTSGLSMYLIGSIFIDRKDPKTAFKELETKADVMLKKKTKIWIFPEGTRNRDFTKLLPFKKGAFAVAIASQVPIIPLVFSPYYFINSKKLMFNRGDVVVQCLEPVPTEGLTMDDLPDLMERVHGVMERTYKELLHEVKSTLPPNYPIAMDK